MTATKTVEVASFAGVFDAEQVERDSRFAGKTRRYSTYSHLSDEEYDKELNDRGFFPWLHVREVLGFDPDQLGTSGSLVLGYSIDDYNTWK
jgi:hypothetical protein